MSATSPVTTRPFDVEQVRKELVAKIGENIQIKRFVRFELGA